MSDIFRSRTMRSRKLPSGSRLAKNLWATPSSAVNSSAPKGRDCEIANPPPEASRYHNESLYGRRNPAADGLPACARSTRLAHRGHSSVPLSLFETCFKGFALRGWIMSSSPTVCSAFNTLPISAVSFPRLNSERKRGLKFPSLETVSSVRRRFFRWARTILPNSSVERIIPYCGFCFFIMPSKNIYSTVKINHLMGRNSINNSCT